MNKDNCIFSRQLAGKTQLKHSNNPKEIIELDKRQDQSDAVKGTRYVEVRWIHKLHHRTKQVRSKTGGGTRTVCMRKDATRKEIMEEARQLFFPDGESKKGKLEDLNYDMWDFSERKLKSDITIQKMYEETKMPMLRFYLATWDKNKDEDAVVHTPNKNQDNVINANLSEDEDTTVAPKLPLLDLDVLEVDTCTNIVSATLQISGIAAEFIIDNYEDLPDPGFNFQMETDVITLTNPEVVTNKQDVHIIVTVTVHRGHVLLDMIRAVKSIDPYNDIISFETIMSNGCIKIAEDDGGVTRDSLTEFWKDFYEQCTEGTSEKVPFLRHDFGEE
ncbi:unnamed protein product [Mytilus coruscus]|uniref:Uncharacterized protein n=1 Tax=Mytilus coruscus TaxID=42192 RepID=A0A6J8CJW9_MYTCO|nr:unnamed protein product [Mytilus coruscus]